MSKQPEALGLADALMAQVEIGGGDLWVLEQAAAELRRLHELNAELVEALRGLCDEQDARQGYASCEAYDKARAAISKAEAA